MHALLDVTPNLYLSSAPGGFCHTLSTIISNLFAIFTSFPELLCCLQTYLLQSCFFYCPGSQPPLTGLLILLANEYTGTLPGIDCLLLNSENLKGSKYNSFFPLHFSIFIFLLKYNCLTMFWVYHRLIQIYIYVCVCVFFFRLFHYKLLQDIECSSPH